MQYLGLTRAVVVMQDVIGTQQDFDGVTGLQSAAGAVGFPPQSATPAIPPAVLGPASLLSSPAARPPSSPAAQLSTAGGVGNAPQGASSQPPALPRVASAPTIQTADEAAAEFGEWARGYGLDQRMSGAKARRDLGWVPAHPEPLADIG